MKRIILSLVLLLGIGMNVVKASDVVPVPKSQDGSPILSPAYGGQLYSACNFCVGNGTISLPGPGYSEIGLTSVNISSGSGGSFVEFFSTVLWTTAAVPFLRVSNTTNTQTASIGGTQTTFPIPFRVLASSIGVNGQAAAAPILFYRITQGEALTTHNVITVGYVLK